MKHILIPILLCIHLNGTAQVPSGFIDLAAGLVHTTIKGFENHAQVSVFAGATWKGIYAGVGGLIMLTGQDPRAEDPFGIKLGYDIMELINKESKISITPMVSAYISISTAYGDQSFSAKLPGYSLRLSKHSGTIFGDDYDVFVENTYVQKLDYVSIGIHIVH